jgi:hypothetical protein
LLAGTETRVDVALLVSALFLQRFSLPFAGRFLALQLVALGLILLHQFLKGKLVIQYDRFYWFLVLGLAATCSLLLNFKSTMLTGYSQFVVFYFLLTLSRPSTPNQYDKMLQRFQLIVILLSCLGVAQFIAQFVVDGTQLVRFYGLLDFLIDPSYDPASAAQGPRNFGGTLKSNAIFLGEPSVLSQITALGILIEILFFWRPRYLLVMAAGFLVAYSGTGLLLLLIFLPLAALRNGRAGLSALFVVMFILGLFATGVIHLDVFTSRVSEFQDTQSSGFVRFVAPFWLAAKRFDTGSLGALLVGSGPGTVRSYGDLWYSHAEVNWFKLFYEYGIIGSFLFCCFLASCFRRSRCSGIVIAALIFNYLFEQGVIAVAIPLCTLNGPEPRRGRVDEASRYAPSLVAGSASG